MWTGCDAASPVRYNPLLCCHRNINNVPEIEDLETVKCASSILCLIFPLLDLCIFLMSITQLPAFLTTTQIGDILDTFIFYVYFVHSEWHYIVPSLRHSPGCPFICLVQFSDTRFRRLPSKLRNVTLKSMLFACALRNTIQFTAISSYFSVTSYFFSTWCTEALKEK